MFSLSFARTHIWANNGDAGDLRRHRAHYDVIVMIPTHITLMSHDSHAVWDHCSLWCLFNSLFRQTSKKHQLSALLTPCEMNPPVTGGFPLYLTSTCMLQYPSCAWKTQIALELWNNVHWTNFDTFQQKVSNIFNSLALAISNCIQSVLSEQRMMLWFFLLAQTSSWKIVDVLVTWNAKMLL